VRAFSKAGGGGGGVVGVVGVVFLLGGGGWGLLGAFIKNRFPGSREKMGVSKNSP